MWLLGFGWLAKHPWGKPAPAFVKAVNQFATSMMLHCFTPPRLSRGLYV